MVKAVRGEARETALRQFPAMPLRPRIDSHSCQSSGDCVKAAPEVFATDADHLGGVRADAATIPDARLIEIARACPALAISLWQDDGTEFDPFA